MAFTATRSTAPGNVQKLPGGFIEAKWTFLNTSGSTGGTIASGMAFVREARVTNTSATTAVEHLASVSGATVTLTTSADVDGDIIIVGRGTA